jgi:protein-tyrosine phosphatase
MLPQVIAYLMKENNMSLADAMKFVKSRRSIVQPNSGFWKQLIIYEGILKSRYVLGYSTAIFI